MAFYKENEAVIKRILSLSEPYTKKIAIITVCIISYAGIGTLFPQFTKQLMGKGLIANSLRMAVKYSLFSFALVLIGLAIGLLETRYYSYVNSKFQRALLKSAFKHTLKIKANYFSNTNYAKIMNSIALELKIYGVKILKAAKSKELPWLELLLKKRMRSCAFEFLVRTDARSD